MRRVHSRRLVDWAFDQALPFWATHGVDRRHGGFVEALELGGAPLDPGFKRVRAMARQVYVFSHATLLGWRPGRPIAEEGFDYLIKRAWRRDQGGWARRLNTQGDVLDATPDLYDTAFCLFALSWYFKASQDVAARDVMRSTARLVPTVFAHPTGEGFIHWVGATCWRQQNPHMHLLEACLAAHSADPDGPYADLGRPLVDLFKRRFFDQTTGTLGEFFTADWARAPGDDGRLVEPGHHFEWAWILSQAEAQFGSSAHQEATALIAFAETHGVDPDTGATFDAVWSDGTPKSRASRTWPNTERLKAAIATDVYGEGVNRAAIEQTAECLMDRYFAPAPKGAWIDHFNDAGEPIATTIPASTFYHVFLAIAELIRIGGPDLAPEL